MKAARLYGPGDLRVEDVPAPSVPPGWVLVRSRVVGICGTDKAFYRGTYPLFKSPLIPGHEVSGEVVEGPRDLVGERVVSEINFACLECDVCRLGLYTHCPRKKTLGIDFDGGMAEYFVAPAWAVHVHSLPHEKAFAAEPLAAVLNAFSQYPLKPGALLAVLGTGFIALLSAQVARLMGARVVVVARRESVKARFFEKHGFRVVDFDEAVDVGRREGLAGLGYDVVVEATGTNEGVAAAIALARPRGVVHLKSTPGGEARIPQTLAVVKELRLVGTRCGTHREFKEAIRLLETDKVEVPVTAEYSLAEAREAFERAMERDAFRVLVRP